MTQSFKEDCRDKGGRLKETANGLVCEITGNKSTNGNRNTDHVTPNSNNQSYNNQSDMGNSWITNSILSYIPNFVNVETEIVALIVLLGGLFVSGGMKAYGMAYTLDHVGFGSHFVPAIVSVFVPIIPYFLYHGLPNWFWYTTSWSWLGDLIVLGVLWALLIDESDFGLIGSAGLGMLAFANAIASTVLAFAISLTTVAGFTMGNFWQLYIVSRLGIAGLVLPVIGSSAFQFSQITWAVVVVLMLLKFGGTTVL